MQCQAAAENKGADKEIVELPDAQTIPPVAAF